MCDANLCYDMTELAARYCQIAGLLAGFAFASIPLLVNRIREEASHPARTRRLEEVLVVLISAFCCLIVVATLYAAMSSEEALGGRIRVEAIVCGVAFAAAIATLLFGLVILVEALDLWHAARWFRLITGGGTPVVACAFICLAFNDAEVARTQNVTWTAVSTATVASILLVLGTSTFAFSRRPIRTGGGSYRVVPVTAMGLSVLSALIFALIPWMDPDDHMPHWANVTGAIAAGILFSAFALFVGSTRSSAAGLE
jgi:hypothetical protein